MSDETSRLEHAERELRDTREALNNARAEIVELRALVGERNTRHLGVVISGDADSIVQALSR